MKGQIIKILSNLYTVDIDGKNYECHSRGKFRNLKITPLVGDEVIVDIDNNYIMDILPRKNSLNRPQVANIDQAFIITSCKEPDFSANLLDKLLTVLHINNIMPIICMTKYDLLKEDEKEQIDMYKKYYANQGYIVVMNTELEKIKELFKDKTSVFTGQTGAGKSTLLNRLDSNLDLETGEISKALGRGKHTTRHVELHKLFGGKVLDTPGFSSIDLSIYTKDEIKNSFIEFNKISCKYSDCSHTNEKECLIKKAVMDKEILESRYDNYIKFIDEVKKR